MKPFKRLLTLFVSLFTTLAICSCESKDASSSGRSPFNPDGSTLSESILSEDIKQEDILTEHELLEYTINVTKIIEDQLEEDILFEDLQVEMYLADDIEGIFDEYMIFNGDAGQYQIDWWKVIGQFAAGTAVIVVTGVAAYFTSEIPGVGFVFATSCKEALKEAIIGAAVGAALNSAIGALVSGGNVDAVTKYAIEGAANGFMWGAISGALLGAFSGYVSYYKDTSAVFEGNKLIGHINKNGEIRTAAGKLAGYKTQNGYILDAANNVLGMADDAGNISSTFTSLIPASRQVLAPTGRSVTYTINASNQVLSSGKVIGTINEAGCIIDSAGHLIGQVDDAGRLVAGIAKTVKAGFKLSPAGTILNSTRVVDGVTQYLDDAGRVIGYVFDTKNSAGQVVHYLRMPVDSSKVKYIGELPEGGLQKMIGQMDDAGNLLSDWSKIFQSERSKGVALAWKQERELVIATGRGTRDWTAEEIAELIATGRVAGYQGHHINSALYSPQLAANPDNIIFYTVVEHLKIGHNGNYHIITFGELLSRIF